MFFGRFPERRVGAGICDLPVVVGDRERRTDSVEVELALAASTVLADDVAVDSRLRRVLGGHDTSLVPLLEDVVGEGVPKEVGFGHD